MSVDDPDNRPPNWPWLEPLSKVRPAFPEGQLSERERYDLISAPPQFGSHRNACSCEACQSVRMVSWDGDSA